MKFVLQSLILSSSLMGVFLLTVGSYQLFGENSSCQEPCKKSLLVGGSLLGISLVLGYIKSGIEPVGKVLSQSKEETSH